MENNKNEIDLLELLIKLYLYLKKYWWISGIAVILGIVFTFIKYKTVEKSYNSTMILSVKPDNDYMYALTFRDFNKRYEKNPAEVIIGILNQANELIKSNNIDILSGKMNLNPDDLQEIKSISSLYKFEKGEAPGNTVKITVVSGNKEIFGKLGKGIEFLINNNPYIKSEISDDSVMLANIIRKTEIKSKELDSLQTKFLKNGKINDLIIFKDNSFFGESVILESLKEKLIKELQNIKKVKTVEDFYIPKSRTESIKKAFIINTLIFLFLGFIIIFFIVFNKKAKEFEKKQKKS